jgi:hypothetical protein
MLRTDGILIVQNRRRTAEIMAGMRRAPEEYSERYLAFRQTGLDSLWPKELAVRCAKHRSTAFECVEKI